MPSTPVYTGCLQTKIGAFYGFREGSDPIAECRRGDLQVSLAGGEIVGELELVSAEVADLRAEVEALKDLILPSPPDPVAYWSFDDQVSPTADEADDHDATVVGATFETGNIPAVSGNNAALALNGADDYAWTPDPDDLDGFTGMTLAAWVNPDTFASPWGSRIIVSKYHSAAPFNTISYWLLLRDDEVEVFVSRQRVVDEDRLISAGVDLALNEWTHVAGTWDGVSLRLYVEGTEVASKATSVSEMDDSSIQVDIGAAEAFANGQRSAFFSGLLDEVYIFDQALTADQIADLATTDS